MPFPKPDGYDPAQYQLLVRIYEAGWRETFQKFDAVPNRKTDSNNHGPFSTDNIGYNYEYPDASYERRREILKEHETLSKGLAVLHRQRSAGAEGRAGGDAPLGIAERRVHRQWRLAAPDLRSRSAPDDRHIRDDRAPAHETASDAGIGGHGLVRH